jgi:hypothetical protein
MIPLSQWLARQVPMPPPVLEDERLSFAAPVENAPGLVDDDSTACDEAYARGKAEAEALAEAQFAALHEAADAARNAAVAAAREAWCSDEAERLAARLDDALATLEQALSRSVAACLTPFLEAEARARAVSDFDAALRRLANHAALIKLEAPPDLAAALQAKGPGLPKGIDLQIGDHADMLAVADATIIESTLGAWVSRLREVQP